jgi:hypothetical protein
MVTYKHVSCLQYLSSDSRWYVFVWCEDWSPEFRVIFIRVFLLLIGVSTDVKTRLAIYSGPSSYDRLYIRTTWVTTKILVLTYDQILSYDPHAGQGHLSYDPHGVRKLRAQIRVFVDVIPVSALLYIINFANCYQNGTQNKCLVSPLGKLLVFLVNYAYYATSFYYEIVR